MGQPQRIEIDLRGWRPNRSQAEFLDARDRLVAFLGGYRAGKTEAGAEKALMLALLNPGCRGLIVAPTYKLLENVTLRAFRKSCPPGVIVGESKKHGTLDILGGGQIVTASADRPESLEGLGVGWFWGDEARFFSAEAWRTIVGRLSDKRARWMQGFVTTTPEMGWLFDEFGTKRPDRRAIHASTIENAAHIADGYVDGLRSSYSARLAKALIEGQFTIQSGAVYEEFDEAKHAIDWALDPLQPVWLSWDFGVRAASILFAQETGALERVVRGRRIPRDSLVVFDELQLDQKPTRLQIPDVKRRLSQLGEHRLWRIAIDPAGRGRDQATGLKSADMLEAAFGRILRWETDVEERHIPNRIARVQGALAPADGHAPRLYFDRKLLNGHRRGVIAALRGSRYPEKAGARLSDRPMVDDYEHARDTLEYLEVAVENDHRRGPQVEIGIQHG